MTDHPTPVEPTAAPEASYPPPPPYPAAAQPTPAPYGAPYGAPYEAPDGAAYEAPYGAAYGSMPTFVPPAPVTEDVARGLLFALAAVPVGVLASVLLWKAGYVASLSAVVLSALAVWLYRRGAGAVGRPGFLVVAGVVVVGLLASMAAIVITDTMDFYAGHTAEIGVSESTFVTSNMFNAELWGSYGSDFGMLALFGALGAAGTLMRLRRATR